MNLKEVDSELLKEELINRGYLRVFWHKEDVISQAKNLDYELTDEEASDIMYNIEQSFDANIGVNWDVISEHIRYAKD